MEIPGRPALDWNAIDTVLLDLDGTLLDLFFDNHFFCEHLPRHMARAHGTSVETARARLNARCSALAGTLDWYCLEFWQRELGLDLVALHHDIGELVRWRPHAPAFLDALATAGKRRVLTTNAHPASLGFKFDRVPAARHFDARYSAHELGAPKEDAAFWDALADREPFSPDRALLVDDNPDVLAAAEAWGIGHLLGIRKPDTRRPPRDLPGFTAVNDFDELEPPPPATRATGRAGSSLAGSDPRRLSGKPVP